MRERQQRAEQGKAEMSEGEGEGETAAAVEVDHEQEEEEEEAHHVASTVAALRRMGRVRECPPISH
jgi:hypothetical protein